MFGRLAFTALLAASTALVHAVVVPQEPGPNVTYQTGQTCRTAWTGDKTSPTAWKNMTIQFMTGDNFHMVLLATLATNLDGTVDGKYEHVCPQVTPNAPIFFYQYTGQLATADGPQWTTRFTIASTTGATVPAPNPTQPNGEHIPWGVGQLVGAVGSTTTNASTATTGSPTILSGATTTMTTGTLLPTTPAVVTITRSPTPSSQALNGTGGVHTTTASGAMRVLDLRSVWMSAVVFGVSVMFA